MAANLFFLVFFTRIQNTGLSIAFQNNFHAIVVIIIVIATLIFSFFYIYLEYIIFKMLNDLNSRKIKKIYKKGDTPASSSITAWRQCQASV